LSYLEDLLPDAAEETTAENDKAEDGESLDILQKDMEQFDNPAAAQRFRRKSVLPVDETVLSELSRHRSLEEVVTQKSETDKSEESADSSVQG
jgi:hypothetical protein